MFATPSPEETKKAWARIEPTTIHPAIGNLCLVLSNSSDSKPASASPATPTRSRSSPGSRQASPSPRRPSASPPPADAEGV